jgi:hypothetical protein
MDNYQIPEFIEKIEKQTSAFLINAEELGIQHARLPAQEIPIDQTQDYNKEYSDLVANLKKLADQNLVHLIGRVQDIENEIKEYEENIMKDPSFVKNQIEYLREERDKRIEECKRAFQIKKDKIGDELNGIDRETKKLEKNFEELKSEVKKYRLDNIIDPRWSIVFIFFLTFLEIPFTYSAFLILKTTPIVSITIAIVLSTVLALSAHFVGASIKTKKNAMVAIALFIISMLAIQVAAHFRTLHANSQQLDMTNWFLPEDIFFVIIGVAIYFVCTGLSYFAHNSNEESKTIHAEFKREKVSYRREKEKLTLDKQKLTEELDSVNAQEQTDLQNIRKECELLIDKTKKEKNEMLKDKREAIVHYNNALKYFQNIEKSVYDNLVKVLKKYRIAYLSVKPKFDNTYQAQKILSEEYLEKIINIDMPLNNYKELNI